MYARYSLLALLASASPVMAKDEDMSPAQAAAVACWETKDWSCAFENLSVALNEPGVIDDCVADSHHGCAYQMIALYIVGIGAAQDADPTRRRLIAERALKLLGQMSEGETDRVGEMPFSALRYDACKTLDDSECVNQSARLIRTSISEDPGAYDGFMHDLTAEGVSYPLNLDEIIAEVAKLELNP